jgi:hypothetical protein
VRPDSLEFSYRSASGDESWVQLDNWTEKGVYLNGTVRGQVRSYRKDRVLFYADGHAGVLREPHPAPPLPPRLPEKERGGDPFYGIRVGSASRPGATGNSSRTARCKNADPKTLAIVHRTQCGADEGRCRSRPGGLCIR